MWQFQVRFFLIIVFSSMFAGCGSISSKPTGSNPPPPNQPQSAHIFVAANYAGADCGAKILAADAAADQNATIEVTPACGSAWRTQVVVGPSHTVLIEDGTYQIASTILLHDGACVAGQNAVLAMTQ